MTRQVTILTGTPTVIPIAQMQIMGDGVFQMANEWVRTHRPECLPDDFDETQAGLISSLFPHDGNDERGRMLTDNELLVELAGRKCYDSFGLKAGKKSNAEYIKNTQGGDIPHASILYHAKMSFFFAGISRRVSHELIRNYVGADRDEEGSPSQESTRFTHHYGFFIAPPRRVAMGESYVEMFRRSMQRAYDDYVGYVQDQIDNFEKINGKKPLAIDRKRIYEDASAMLPHAAETSFIWTTNPMAIAKLVRERADNSADLEIQRFARELRRVSVERWPNLFTQPWMNV